MLEQGGDLVDVGGQAYLVTLDVDVIPAHLDDYIDRLKELRGLREAAVSAEQFLGGLGAAVPAKISAALADLEARLAGVSASIDSARAGRSRCLAEIAPPGEAQRAVLGRPSGSLPPMGWKTERIHDPSRSTERDESRR